MQVRTRIALVTDILREMKWHDTLRPSTGVVLRRFHEPVPVPAALHREQATGMKRIRVVEIGGTKQVAPRCADVSHRDALALPNRLLQRDVLRGAAARLGLNRSTLQFRMKKLGISRTSLDAPLPTE
jgi:hypothetical protein